MENIGKDVYNLLEIRSIFADALRSIGWDFCKFLYTICNTVFKAIDDFFSVDMIGNLMNKYNTEILTVSVSLFTLTLMIFFIMKMIDSKSCKGFFRTVIVSMLFLTCFTSIEGFVTMGQDAVRDYAYETQLSANNPAEEIMKNNIYDVSASVNSNTKRTLAQTQSGIDVTTIDINESTDEAPLDKHATSIVNGKVQVKDLSNPWYGFGQLKEENYIYSVDYFAIIIFLIVLTIGISASLFKIAHYTINLAYYTILSPLFVVTDLGGTRTKGIITHIIGTISALLLYIFSFKIVVSLLDSALAIDNLIVSLVYVLALSGMLFKGPELIFKLLNLETPQRGIVSRMLMSYGIRSGIRGAIGIASNGASSLGNTVREKVGGAFETSSTNTETGSVSNNQNNANNSDSSGGFSADGGFGVNRQRDINSMMQNGQNPFSNNGVNSNYTNSTMHNVPKTEQTYGHDDLMDGYGYTTANPTESDVPLNTVDKDGFVSKQSYRGTESAMSALNDPVLKKNDDSGVVYKQNHDYRDDDIVQDSEMIRDNKINIDEQQSTGKAEGHRVEKVRDDAVDMDELSELLENLKKNNEEWKNRQ